MKIEFAKGYFLIPFVMILAGIYVHFTITNTHIEEVEDDVGEIQPVVYTLPPKFNDYIIPVLGSGIISFGIIYTTERLGCFRPNEDGGNSLSNQRKTKPSHDYKHSYQQIP